MYPELIWYASFKNAILLEALPQHYYSFHLHQSSVKVNNLTPIHIYMIVTLIHYHLRPVLVFPRTTQTSLDIPSKLPSQRQFWKTSISYWLCDVPYHVSCLLNCQNSPIYRFFSALVVILLGLRPGTSCRSTHGWPLSLNANRHIISILDTNHQCQFQEWFEKVLYYAVLRSYNYLQVSGTSEGFSPPDFLWSKHSHKKL